MTGGGSPSLKDVASATGLSIKTISRALRGEPNVADATRRMVQKEADRLGVQVNDVAAGLRRKSRAMTSIGVLLGDLANPFFAEMLKGIDSVAAKHQHVVLTADAKYSPETERKAIRSFLAHRVAGLIIAPSGEDWSYLNTQAAYDAAVVFVDAPPLGAEDPLDSVTTTSFESTKLGIERLIGLGHRRIGYLGHPRGGTGANERWAGYLAALAEAGLEADQQVIKHDLVTEADATEAAEAILAHGRPDALMVDNNQLCVGLLQSPRYAQLRPETLCFDNFTLAPQFGISVIDSNPYVVGRTGAQLLFERLADRDRAPQHIRVPANLVINDQPTY